MTPLVVASYNIHKGVGLDRRRDLDRLAAVIREIDPDIVGLQEVIRRGGGAEDQAAYLAGALGMEMVMGETRVYGDGTYGNAVLTRVPVVGCQRCDLSQGRREPRGCLRVDLAVNGNGLHLFNCHLGLGLAERRRQLRLLAEFIGASAGLAGPRVLVGDFNEWHPGPITRRLRREFASRMRRVRRTHPAVFPLFALDRIYWDAELEGEEVRVHRSRLARIASDHLPVVARLRVRHRERPAAWVAAGDLPPAE